jgi:Rps23 Pro-64 3,4-dihydroxylase Tpa1-like proline 4-hydroxylase
MKFIDLSTEELHAFGKAKHEEYAKGSPFPNIYFDNFFNEEMLSKVLEEFPDMHKRPDLQFNDPNQIKLASKGEYRFGEVTKAFAYFLNSQTFLEFLTNLTGIKALIPDPYFEGAGCHQIMPGGLLRIHADFNKQKLTNLDRRLNVLVYLNKDWEEAWGGYFELWDKDMQGAVKRILPVFNRMAIFSTTTFSYHGHPDPLKCPDDRSRKSFALYYYTNGRPEEEVVEGLEYHSTVFKARPGMQEKVDVKEPVTAKTVIRDLTPPIILKGLKRILR